MSERYRYRPACLLELTTPQMAALIHNSQTQPRRSQKRYLKDLGGAGDASELDEAVSTARCNQEAVEQAEILRREWECSDDARSVSSHVSQAVNFFVHSLIAGDFGPDDSRDGRSDAFLKKPHAVARTTEIFLERLLVDGKGKVINHDEAERHARDFLEDMIETRARYR